MLHLCHGLARYCSTSGIGPPNLIHYVVERFASRICPISISYNQHGNYNVGTLNSRYRNSVNAATLICHLNYRARWDNVLPVLQSAQIIYYFCTSAEKKNLFQSLYQLQFRRALKKHVAKFRLHNFKNHAYQFTLILKSHFLYIAKIYRQLSVYIHHLFYRN